MNDYSIQGRRAIELELDGVKRLAKAMSGQLGEDFTSVIKIILNCEGHIVFTGIGKSGHIAKKICSTFSSLGLPSYFLHPSEAAHGDLGALSGGGHVVIALSWSGESVELTNVIQYALSSGIPLVGITGNKASTLAKRSSVCLVLPDIVEACPNGLAPTTSTTLQLIIGDALAATLAQAKGFTPSDFKLFHPGGKLGAQLKAVAELMHTGESIPLVNCDESVTSGIIEITSKHFGIVGIIDRNKRLVGVVTDGDLRRTLRPDVLNAKISDIMSINPQIIGPELSVNQAIKLMNTLKITSLFVVEAESVVGIIHIHDIIRINS